MKRRIARHNRTAERPFIWILCQVRTQWIVENVMAHANERIAAAFFLLQDMTVGLVLNFCGMSFGFRCVRRKAMPLC